MKATTAMSETTDDPHVYCVDHRGMWWPAWERPGTPFKRWATTEEHALMEKVVWHSETAAEAKRLMDLLNGSVQ